MEEYKLDISEDEILIKGDIVQLKRYSFVYSFLKKEMSSFFTDEMISVKYRDKRKDLIKIKKIFNRFNIILIDAESIDDEFNLIKSEEMNFRVFGEKAREIRNNNCDKYEFKNFTDVIEKSIVNRDLYPLQLLSAYHMAFSQNACNFSVPGAGKTSIVYAAFAYLNSLEGDNSKFVDKVLVIGPLSSFGPWESEYEECFGKKPVSQRISSSEKIDKNYFFSTDQTANLILISYQGLLTCSEAIIGYLKRNKVLIVLDEAHKIKNIDDGSISNTTLLLSPYAKARIILTGTPVPNGYEDLYNIFKFIWPTKNIIGLHSYQLKDLTKNPDGTRIENLVHNIEPFFIRIKKSDMGKMPEQIEMSPIYVGMDKAQRQIYDSIEKRIVEDYLNKEQESFVNDMKKAKLIRLLQVSSNINLLNKPIIEKGYSKYDCHFEIDKDLLILIESYNLVPPKFIASLELTKKIIDEGEKIIIWCNFIDNILGLSDYLIENGIYNRVLYGDIPTKSDDIDINLTREGIINEFHENQELKVIIANPHAVGESISIHKACRNALYFEKSFNATHFLQSRDRIHRYGLKPDDQVKYYYLISKDSIDEIVHERLFFKKARMEEIIEKNPIPLFDNLQDDIGDEDIKSLVRAYVERNKI